MDTSSASAAVTVADITKRCPCSSPLLSVPPSSCNAARRRAFLRRRSVAASTSRQGAAPGCCQDTRRHFSQRIVARLGRPVTPPLRETDIPSRCSFRPNTPAQIFAGLRSDEKSRFHLTGPGLQPISPESAFAGRATHVLRVRDDATSLTVGVVDSVKNVSVEHRFTIKTVECGCVSYDSL